MYAQHASSGGWQRCSGTGRRSQRLRDGRRVNCCVTSTIRSNPTRTLCGQLGTADVYSTVSVTHSTWSWSGAHNAGWYLNAVLCTPRTSIHRVLMSHVYAHVSGGARRGAALAAHSTPGTSARRWRVLTMHTCPWGGEVGRCPCCTLDPTGPPLAAGEY